MPAMLVKIDRLIRHARALPTHHRGAFQRPGGFLGGAMKLDGAAAGFFFSVDFGFLRSRLLRFCPLAMPALPGDQMRL